MNDLISRQMAQTELMMKCERYTLARESHGMGHVEWSSDLISVADAMDAIRELPSAEPEIIRCKDCKFTDGEKPIADGRYWCVLHQSFMYYCSDAERKDDVCHKT